MQPQPLDQPALAGDSAKDDGRMLEDSAGAVDHDEGGAEASLAEKPGAGLDDSVEGVPKAEPSEKEESSSGVVEAAEAKEKAPSAQPTTADSHVEPNQE